LSSYALSFYASGFKNNLQDSIHAPKKMCGIGESGVSQACRRFKEKLRNDKKLERKITKIEKKLNVSRMKT
jgi:hypothetical protein